MNWQSVYEDAGPIILPKVQGIGDYILGRPLSLLLYCINIKWVCQVYNHHYFDLDRAKLEIADWLTVRHQEVTKDWYDEIEERDWLLEGLAE